MDENQELTLWILSEHFAPIWSGPAVRFSRYASKFKESGISTTFITMRKPNLPQSEMLDDIPVKRVWTPFPKQLFPVAALLSILKTKTKPDVVLMLSWTYLVFPFVALLRNQNILCVFVSTMSVAESYIQPSSFFLRIRRKLYFQALNWLDIVVCSTQNLGHEMHLWGVQKNKIQVITNGVSLDRFRPLDDQNAVEELRLKLNLPVSIPICLFVGLRNARKGVLELTQAWMLYKSRGGRGALLLVGDEDPGDSTFDEKWHNCLSNLRPEHNVIIRPPYSNIEEYMQVSDLFVFLSNKEGMPNVLPEAMACGLPILTTRFDGFSSELGRPDVDMVVTDREPETVSKHIEILLADKARRHELSKNARQWVQENNNLEKTLDTYIKLLSRKQHI